MVKVIGRQAPALVSTYREKLHQRLEEAGLENVAGDERIIREIALFADRCDISEETVRLQSHLKQFRQLLRSSGPVGRTLDFLCQEMFREINTIGSKANDAAIQRLVVMMKDELEKIKEQLNNVL